MTFPMDREALEELKRLCEKATQGRRAMTWNMKTGVKIWANGMPILAPIGGLSHSRITPDDAVPQWRRDVDFTVACDPETVLQLIAEVEQLQGDLRDAQDDVTSPTESNIIAGACHIATADNPYDRQLIDNLCRYVRDHHATLPALQSGGSNGK